MNMKQRKGVQLACVSLAAALTCGTLAGCNLISTDSKADMEQVVAEVNISRAADFQTGGEYAQYADVIGTSTVLKRDLVANFLSYGYQYVQSYGYSYEQTFTLIKDNLVKRNMLLQYAMVALFEDETASFTVEGYNAARNASTNKTEREKDIAGIKYFLSEEEEARAEFTLKKTINSSLDSQETTLIKEETGKEYETNVRATPTGVGSANEDFYDPAYKIYTGRNLAAECGSYEAVDGSTPATRKKAYSSFLANLMENDLLTKGEDVTQFENLDYYKTQLLVAYQDGLMKKLSDLFEKQAEDKLTQSYVEGKYNELLADQRESYKNSADFEEALGSVSDTSFALSAPNAKYGFVINILLPFSETQKDLLSSNSDELTEAGKYAYRAKLLESVKATDQRASWFTGETDHSYKSDLDGKYYFFEDGVKDDPVDGEREYEKIKNYAGSYPYQGEVEYDEDEEKYTLTPDKIDIKGFISAMETQLSTVGTASGDEVYANYYTRAESEYYKNYGTKDEEIDYSKFLFYKGKVDLGSETANDVFDPTSKTNRAMSIINELSFAYNTDTAGLNSYLGYAVSAYKTSFVSEFEYAAKEAVLGGVGTYTVAPSEYGWHIMYCTFSYTVNGADYKEPYRFDWTKRNDEGQFSNLYYEALKDATVSDYSSRIQTKVSNAYLSCVTVYEDRYQDLLNLDK